MHDVIVTASAVNLHSSVAQRYTFVGLLLSMMHVTRLLYCLFPTLHDVCVKNVVMCGRMLFIKHLKHNS
jgi:hypothetical protein